MNNDQSVTLDERIAHYVHASRGSKERALLLALNAGFDFKAVVLAMGDEGVRVSFQCILNGWVDRGAITEAGRAWLQQGAEA